jgi:hypothetical protein
MQAIFSFQRLGLLIRKQWAERARLYLLMMAALTGLLIIAFILWWTISDQVLYSEPLFIFFFVGLFLGGCIMAGMTFSDLAQRTTGIYYLGVPATHGEKLVCGILFSQVFFNAAYTAIFFLVKAGALGLIAMNPHIHVERLHESFDAHNVAHYLLILYTAIQTFYLLGSVYFERFAFVKTTVAGAVAVVAFVLFVIYVLGSIVNGQNFGIHDMGVVRLRADNGEIRLYTFPLWLAQSLWFLLRFIWAPVFWVVAYFRLREKEL